MDILKIISDTDETIKDIAIRGDCDWCFGKHFILDIYWKAVGRYLFVYIEDHFSDLYFYRLFDCGTDAYYEKDLVLAPSYDDDRYKCLYDHIDGADQSLHISSDDWYDDLTRAVEYYNSL